MKEEWRPIHGFEGFYEVSDQGDVRSVTRSTTDMGGRRTRTFKGRVMAPYITNGYAQLKLKAGSVKRGAAVHVFVAEAFIGPRPAGAVLRHINGDALDNRAANLKYELESDAFDGSRDGEEWRPVVGFEKFYEVSNLGRIRSLPRTYEAGFGTKTKPMTLMRPSVGQNGYEALVLKAEGRSKTRTVHSLVAEAFIGPRPTDHDICHGNGNKTDNRAANLRYGSRTANLLDAVKHGQHAGAAKTHCVNGHEYTPENTLANSAGAGRRRCKTCVREQQRRSSAKHRAKKARPAD